MFLWIFAMLDVYKRLNSRYSDIPWSFLNISKAIILFVLISLVCIDLAMLLTVDDGTSVYEVQYVTIAMKLSTFVSSI